MSRFLLALLLLVFANFSSSFVAAEQPITLKDVPEGLPIISPDEPMAAEFSAAKAAFVNTNADIKAIVTDRNGFMAWEADHLRAGQS